MYKSIKIIFIPLLIVVIIVLVLLLQSWLIMSSEGAKLSGSFSTGLLNGNVEILTDSSSFYTVKAESPSDLAFGLGYLNASEKLFETSFLLLAIKGEASKILDTIAIKSDVFALKRDFVAEGIRALDSLSHSENKILDQFVKGFNFYIANQSNRITPEFAKYGIKAEKISAQDVAALICFYEFALNKDESLEEFLNYFCIISNSTGRNFLISQGIEVPFIPSDSLRKIEWLRQYFESELNFRRITNFNLPSLTTSANFNYRGNDIKVNSFKLTLKDNYALTTQLDLKGEKITGVFLPASPFPIGFLKNGILFSRKFEYHNKIEFKYRIQVDSLLLREKVDAKILSKRLNISTIKGKSRVFTYKVTADGNEVSPILYQNEVYIDSFYTRKDQFVIEVANPYYNFSEKIANILRFYESNFDESLIDKYFKGNTVLENKNSDQIDKFTNIFLYNYNILSSDTLVSESINKLLNIEETLIFAPFEFEFVRTALKNLSVENFTEDNQKIAYSILNSWNGITNAELQAPLVAEIWLGEFYKRKFHEIFSLDSYFLMRNLYGFPFTFAEYMIKNQIPSDSGNYHGSTRNFKDIVQTSFINTISLLEQKFGENIVVWQLKKTRLENLAHISHTNFDDLSGALSSISFYDRITETGSAAIFVEMNGSFLLKTFNRENFFQNDLPTSAVLNLSHIETGKKTKLKLVLF